MAALTAVALAALGADLASADREATADHGDRAAEANAALVGRFYDAVNATLATGDAAPLADVVAADFADHTAHPGIAPGRAGLVQHLLALRASFPAAWLVVEELHPHGAWVLAHLRVEGGADGAFFGLTVAGAPAGWEAVELVRVAGGRVAERQGAGGWPVLPQPLAAAPLADPPASAFVRLGRLIYGPGVSQPETAALGPLLLAVEVGTLSVAVEGEAVLARAATAGTSGPPQPSAPPAGDVLLGAGDALALSSGARYAVRNAGQAPAVVLTLALLPRSPDTPEGTQPVWWEAWVPGVDAQTLAEGVVTDLPMDSATVALGRVTLAARAELSADGTTGLRLAAVEAGILQLATAAGLPSTLSAGQGALVPPGSAPALRNAGDGPLVVLLATISPTVLAEAAAPTVPHVDGASDVR